MKKSTVMTAALTGLLLFSGCATTTAEKGEKMEGECHGVNGCKGKGECGGKGHACAGKNSCKGAGWSKMEKSKCEEMGGKFKGEETPKHHKKHAHKK